jgi:hypothetical protein
MAHRVARVDGEIVEVPIEFLDRARGTSKMSFRIIVEALLLVTWWGVSGLAQRRSVRAASVPPAPEWCDVTGMSRPETITSGRNSGMVASASSTN